MLLLSSHEALPVEIKTSWGKQLGVTYLGKNFLPTCTFTELQEALQVCRANLEVGLFSIVLQSKDHVGVWSLALEELL